MQFRVAIDQFNRLVSFLVTRAKLNFTFICVHHGITREPKKVMLKLLDPYSKVPKSLSMVYQMAKGSNVKTCWSISETVKKLIPTWSTLFIILCHLTLFISGIHDSSRPKRAMHIRCIDF
jgi:hypothetical protein